MEKTITLTEEEKIDLLTALSLDLTGCRATRKELADHQVDAEYLKWYDDKIQRLEALTDRLLRLDV